MDSITRFNNRSMMNRDSEMSESNRSSRTPSTSGVQVSGGTISWPADGWYEVQYASSYNTVSEGGSSATVDAGIYNIINHTTGERFESIVVGSDADLPMLARRQTTTERLSATPSTTERLLDSDTYSGNQSLNDGPSRQANVQSEVTVTVETRPDDDGVEDFRSDERNTIAIGAGVSLVGAGITLINGPVGVGVIIADAAGVGGSLLENRLNNTETVKTTTVVNEDGSITRTQTGDTKNQDNDPIRSTTTRTTTYDDNRQVVSRFDSMTGIERTTDTNEFGVTSVTVSRPDNSAASSPRTNTTYDEDGVARTTVTSPTGGTYGPAGTNGVEVEETETPAPARSESSRPSNQNSENDSNSHGQSSSRSGFGDRTSQPGGMGGV